MNRIDRLRRPAFLAALFLIAACGSDEGTVIPGDGDVDLIPETAEDMPLEPDADAPDGPDVPDGADVPDGDGTPDLEPDGTVEVVWDVSIVDDSDNFKSRAAIALDADGYVHLAYNIATDPEGWYTPSVWYATNRDGSWSRLEAAPANGFSNEYPVIVVDSAGIPHIFYNRYIEAQEQIELFHVAGNGSGGFNDPQNITLTTDADEYAPSAFIETDDTVHIVFQRRTGTPETGYAYGVGYMTLSGGTPSSIEEVTAESSPASLDPGYDVAVDADGSVHVLFCKVGDTDFDYVLHYRQKSGSGWGVEERLTETSLDVFSPGMDVDAAGNVHIAYVKGPAFGDKNLQYNRLESGGWVGEQTLSTFPDDRSYYLGLAAERTSSEVHIAFKRYYDSNGDIFYLRRDGGSFDEEYRVTETADMDEGVPAAAVHTDGTLYISFAENIFDAPNGTIYLATRSEVVVP